jgi:2'-phosphotransferase
MQSSSEILIYINLQKSFGAGLKFYLASNGFVLTEGNELGFIEPQFFEKVERVSVEKGPAPGWEGAIEG